MSQMKKTYYLINIGCIHREKNLKLFFVHFHCLQISFSLVRKISHHSVTVWLINVNQHQYLYIYYIMPVLLCLLGLICLPKQPGPHPVEMLPHSIKLIYYSVIHKKKLMLLNFCRPGARHPWVGAAL